MSNPQLLDCPQDVWTPVAINVTTGQVKKIGKKPNLYLETYRMTGGDTPTKRAEGVPIFINSYAEIISAAAAIDVYIMAVGNDGKVRIDL